MLELSIKIGAFLVAILIMNAGNYGIPVNSFAFGPASLAPASVSKYSIGVRPPRAFADCSIH